MARTRSAGAHKKVLDAALELVAERGIEATSMDAIAQKSGVSKATIYKHWTDKHALLLELLAEVCGLTNRPVFDSGNTQADMIGVLSYEPNTNAEIRERLTRNFAYYSATNIPFGAAWRNMVLDPPREELKHLMKLGMNKGELVPNLDIDLSLTLLLGPIMYSHIFLKKTAANRRTVAEGIVSAFWRAFGTKSPPDEKPQRLPQRHPRRSAPPDPERRGATQKDSLRAN